MSETSSRLTDERLREIRQRTEAATAGPWEYDDSSGSVYTRDEASMVGGAFIAEVDREGDGPFIAAAREDVSALLAAYDTLRGESEHWRTAYLDAVNGKPEGGW